MITGDNLLTALAVSHKLEFGPIESLELHTKDGNNFSWIDHNDKHTYALINNLELEAISKKHTLCLIGPTIDIIIKHTSKERQKLIYKYV